MTDTIITAFLIVPWIPGTAPAPAVRDAAEPPVTLTWSEPVRLAYRGYAGPYWRAGPALNQVRADMQRLGQSGPMFIRFLDDPTRAEGGRVQAQIGFLWKGEGAAPSPYRMETRRRTRVAVMVLENRPPSPRRDYRRL
ncbi:MAG: hypothetical protein D6788_06180, partial [Planctomycetota bacterium]